MRENELSLSLFVSLALSVSDSFSLIHIPRYTIVLPPFPVDSGTHVGLLLGDGNFLEGRKTVGGPESMVQWKEG